MTILVYFAVHGRRPVLELFILGLKRLQLYSGHQVKPFAVCTTNSDSEYLSASGIQHVVHPNRPLSSKMEYGFQQACNESFDYLLSMGSDDLLDHNVFPDYYDRLMEKRTPYIALKSLGFIHARTKRSCYRVCNDPNGIVSFGAGRMLSRRVCDVMQKTVLYTARQLNKGLGGSSDGQLKKNGFTPYVVDTPGRIYLIDVKSKTNIWSYDDVDRMSLPVQKSVVLTHFLSVEETACLDAL